MMNHRTAFSLVELSIVLVILGLLVGGVLSGQSLIRASELRAVTSEYQRYTTAMGTFKDKYFALPGDFNNATAFWGTAAACPGISTTAAGGTCNGDGTGQITQSAPSSNEVFRFWQHLALAGLVEGNYTGTSADTTATNVTFTFGTNAPKSKMSNGGWGAYYMGTIPITDTTWFDGTYGNIFFFGANGGTNSFPTGVILKPEEAWNIDTKLDDGTPATGLVRTAEAGGGANASTGCSDTPASAAVSLANSNYSLGNSSIACFLLIKSGY